MKNAIAYKYFLKFPLTEKNNSKSKILRRNDVIVKMIIKILSSLERQQ